MKHWRLVRAISSPSTPFSIRFAAYANYFHISTSTRARAVVSDLPSRLAARSISSRSISRTTRISGSFFRLQCGCELFPRILYTQWVLIKVSWTQVNNPASERQLTNINRIKFSKLPYIINLKFKLITSVKWPIIPCQMDGLMPNVNLQPLL